MAAFSSLPAALVGSANPFQALWAPLFGSLAAQAVGSASKSKPRPVATSPATPSQAPPAPEPTDGAGTPAPPKAPTSGSGAGDGEGGRVPSRGRTSLVATSMRGVLTPKPAGLSRKTLLGE